MSNDTDEGPPSLKRQLQQMTPEERASVLDKKPYQVGYGKPPQATRFQPGQSGNRKGRPRGTLNISSIIDIESMQKVAVNEGGRRRTLSKAQVGIRQLFNKAANGDPKAIVAALELLRKNGKMSESPAPIAPAVEPRDVETAARLLEFFQSSSAKGADGGDNNK